MPVFKLTVRISDQERLDCDFWDLGEVVEAGGLVKNFDRVGVKGGALFGEGQGETDGQAGRGGDGNPANPESGEEGFFLRRFADCAQDVAGKERRSRRLAGMAQKPPEGIVFRDFFVHTKINPSGVSKLRRKLHLVRVKESFELANAGGVAHFAKSFGLDLTNAFAGDLELTSDFLEGAAVAVDQAEALLEHLTLALGERFQDVLDFVLEKNNRGHIRGIFRAFVFDEISETGVVTVANGGLE